MINLDYKVLNLRNWSYSMRKIQALNINNSYRSLNLNTRLNYQYVQKIIQVTRLNEDKLEQQIEDGTLDKEARYVLYHFDRGIGENDTLNAKLMKLNVPISYFTNSVAPLHIIKGLANNKRGEIVYQIAKEFTKEQVENVYTASQLCRTAITCPVVYPDIKTRQILFSLWDLRYIVDRIDITYPQISDSDRKNGRADYYTEYNGHVWGLNNKYKLDYYIGLHEVLARWKIQLWLVCDSEDETKYLEEQGEKYSHELQ